MKLLLFAIIALLSCTSYQSFVTVKDREDIPDGSKEFIVLKGIQVAKDSLRINTIPYYVHEWGIETHEILIDEGTRAVYKVYALDSVSFKVTPYWGYTDKVVSQAALWGGTAATQSMSDEMTRVIYKDAELRPKRVFDYAVQLFGADRIY